VPMARSPEREAAGTGSFWVAKMDCSRPMRQWASCGNAVTGEWNSQGRTGEFQALRSAGLTDHDRSVGGEQPCGFHQNARPHSGPVLSAAAFLRRIGRPMLTAVGHSGSRHRGTSIPLTHNSQRSSWSMTQPAVVGATVRGEPRMVCPPGRPVDLMWGTVTGGLGRRRRLLPFSAARSIRRDEDVARAVSPPDASGRLKRTRRRARGLRRRCTKMISRSSTASRGRADRHQRHANVLP